MEKKITTTEWNSCMAKEAEELIRTGKMPSLDEVIAAVAPGLQNPVLVPLPRLCNEKGDDITDEEAAAPWVSTAMESKHIKDEALKKVFHKRFGPDAVLYDGSDVGSNREAVAKGRPVVNRGAVTPELRKKLIKVGIKKAGEEFSTHHNAPDNIIPDDKLNAAQKRYKQFVQEVSPLVLKHPLKKVEFADDPDADLYGCTKWLDPKGYTFTVNVAHHDVTDWKRNYDLFIHELAHFHVRRNDHLFEGFWRACSDMGAKLAQVALERPELFPIPVRELVAAQRSTAWAQGVICADQPQARVE